MAKLARLSSGAPEVALPTSGASWVCTSLLIILVLLGFALPSCVYSGAPWVCTSLLWCYVPLVIVLVALSL